MGLVSISFSGVSEFFLVSDFSVTDFEGSSVGINSGFSINDGLSTNFHIGFISSDGLFVGNLKLVFGFSEVV